jgi:3-methyladenine DNA glycosylase AlkD
VVKKSTRSPDPVAEDLQAALVELERMSTKRDRDNLARFGITATRPFGVSMANLKLLAKRLGHNHELAAALWETGRYEARMLATLIDDPALVTPAQMERWCRDFDNWGICDTACFVLFDRTPYAWAKVSEWSGRPEEFVKRAAFALIACLALHDKDAEDAPFIEALRLIEQGAGDERNFVKKGVSWAIRLVGRRNAALNAAAVAVARRLSESEDAAARWVGRGALKELTSAAVQGKLARRRGTPGTKAAAVRRSAARRKRVGKG